MVHPLHNIPMGVMFVCTYFCPFSADKMLVKWETMVHLNVGVDVYIFMFLS